MGRIFAVTRSRGPQWNKLRSLEQQEDWLPHAKFMNALQGEGFVLLGGPLEGTADVLLIIRAKDADDVRARLAGDPWTSKGLLTIKEIIPWTLRLGSLGWAQMGTCQENHRGRQAPQEFRSLAVA